jgi:phage gp36-like protein
MPAAFLLAWMTMPYATITDMILKFGTVEMIRHSVAGGELPAHVEAPRVEDALAASSVLIDSYLRKRYPLPLPQPPSELNRAACVLARYDLATGADRSPSEDMRLARKEVIAWLEAIAAGRVELAGVAPIGTSGAEAQGARVSDRPAAFRTPPGGGL